MAFNFSGKPDTNDGEEVPVPSYVPAPVVPASAPVTVIAKGVRIEGDFGGEGDMRIEGEVSGKLTVGGTLTVGPEASIKAEIKAGSAVVLGKIEGNITAEKRVELKSSANIKGDLKTQTLSVEPGAKISGSMSVGGSGGES
ncbi:MAG TPA: polymer-forming cytoskeletal protein [Verrucomicrobiae bacterium]|nr:polymer-forming cytoskeletal protein [Verrucomicrobiae bacterium]